MGVRVGSLAPESFAKMGVPIVLDLVIGSTRKPTGDERPTVAEKGMQSDDEVIFVGADIPSLNVRS